MTKTQITKTANDMIQKHGSADAAKTAAWVTASELWSAGDGAAEDWRRVIQAIEATAA